MLNYKFPYVLWLETWRFPEFLTYNDFSKIGIPVWKRLMIATMPSVYVNIFFYDFDIQKGKIQNVE